MVTPRPDVAERDEFLALVLADPDLLDLAFAEVIASWEAESPEPPEPPDRTLVAAAELPGPRPRSWRANGKRQCWHGWLRAIPGPEVARSPPELSVGGDRVDPKGALPRGLIRFTSTLGSSPGSASWKGQRRWSLPRTNRVWATNAKVANPR